MHRYQTCTSQSRHEHSEDDEINGIETAQTATIATTVCGIFAEYFPQHPHLSSNINPPSAAD